MRVAHLTTSDLALVTLLRRELELGVKLGHDVLAISAPGRFHSELSSLGVTHVSLPDLRRSWAFRSDLKAAVSLWTTLRRLRPDVLHTHTPKAGVIGRIVGRAAGVPIIANTCHGLWATPEDPRLKRIFVYTTEGFASLFSDVEFYQNAEDQHSLRAWVRDKSELVGNGTDLNRFQFDLDGRRRLRAEWGLRDSDIAVGAVGRVVAMKGVREFAAAASLLGSQATFLWIGPPDPDKSDAIEVQSDHVAFIGERRDMPAVYSALDIFVLPSYREGLPRSAMEAAACGRPIVLTSVRGSRDFGTDGVDVVYVPPRDARGLAAAIQRLLVDGATRDELAQGALRLAHDRYNQDRVARASYTAYYTTAKRKHLPNLIPQSGGT